MTIDENELRELIVQIGDVLDEKPLGLVTRALLLNLTLIIVDSAKTRETRNEYVNSAARDLKALVEIATPFERDHLDG